MSSLAYGSNDDGAGGSRSDAPIVKTVDFGAPPPRASTTAPSPPPTAAAASKQAPPARQMSSVAVEEQPHGEQQQLHGEEVMDVVAPPTKFAPPSTGEEGC